MIIAGKYPSRITIIGSKISSIFGFIYILAFARGGFDSLCMILLFIGIIVILFIATQLFIYETYFVYNILEKIPTTKDIYIILRSIPRYL